MRKPNCRIAVVDDDASVRKALVRLLETSSYDAHGFPSARELLFGLADARPECMIVDLQMPNMSGLELQHHLARTGIKIPTIVITPHDEPRSRERRRRRSLSAQADWKGRASYGDRSGGRNADLTPLGHSREGGQNVPTRRAYQQVVDRFQAAVRATPGTRVPEICETIAASQRRSCGPSVPSTHTPVRFA
jgi:CheY-like chemotaxis protein